MKKIPNELHTPKSAYDDAFFSWIVPTRHEKGWLWFTVAGLLAAFLVWHGLRADSWTFSLAVVVFAGVYVLFHFNHPKEAEVKVSTVGVKVGGEVFPFTHMRYFYMQYDPPFVSHLTFKMTDRLHSEITLQLPFDDPTPLREFMTAQIPEWEGKSEGFTKAFCRLIKF